MPHQKNIKHMFSSDRANVVLCTRVLNLYIQLSVVCLRASVFPSLYLPFPILCLLCFFHSFLLHTQSFLFFLFLLYFFFFLLSFVAITNCTVHDSKRAMSLPQNYAYVTSVYAAVGITNHVSRRSTAFNCSFIIAIQEFNKLQRLFQRVAQPNKTSDRFIRDKLFAEHTITEGIINYLIINI